MDPLSISVGVVTLLGAVKSIQKRISATRHAPQEVKILQQELNCLQDLLQQVENAASTQTENSNAKGVSGKATGLDLQTAQLSAKLQEFEQLLRRRSTPLRLVASWLESGVVKQVASRSQYNATESYRKPRRCFAVSDISPAHLLIHALLPSVPPRRATKSGSDGISFELAGLGLTVLKLLSSKAFHTR